MKENSNLRTELTALREHVDKVKDEAIVEFQTSQAYFDEIGIQYGNDFEDFHKQAILLFPSMDFSQVQINTSIPMTPVGGDVLDEERPTFQRRKPSVQRTWADRPEGKETDEQPTKPTDNPQA